MNTTKIKQFFKYGGPTHRIILKEYNGQVFYLIQKRVLWNWEYIKDQTKLGFDCHPVEYEAYFETMEQAEERLRYEIAKEHNDRVVTKVVKSFYTDPQLISTIGE